MLAHTYVSVLWLGLIAIYHNIGIMDGINLPYHMVCRHAKLV